MGAFQKAVRRNVRLRLALEGPAGSGKTYTALKLARLVFGPAARIAVIDTEHESAALYADTFDFDHAPLRSHAPARYVELLHEADREGYDVVIVDSLSHAWSGKDGALEMVDKRSKGGGNSFDAWRHVTPEHNKLVDALLSMRAHLIVTLRTKTAYVVEQNEKGKSAPRKIGMQAIQREGVDYEFSIVGDLDQSNVLTITKTRCSALFEQSYTRPGDDLALPIRAWLAAGAPEETKAPARTVAEQLVALLDGVQDAPELAKASEAGKRAWAKLTKAEQATVTAAVKRAKERVAEHEEAAAARATDDAQDAPAPDPDEPDPDPNNGAETAGDDDPGAEAA